MMAVNLVVTMFLHTFLLNLLLCFHYAFTQMIDKKETDKSLKKCEDFMKNPYFDPEMVVGSWKIYYSWDMDLDEKCLEVIFKYPTSEIVRRIQTDMYDYMIDQPYWESASLFVTLHNEEHEMLFFPAQGPAGSYDGLPNVKKAGHFRITQTIPRVSLQKFRFKLFREGKFLIMMDCRIGMATLMARTETIPYRSEIEEVVKETGLNEGYHACRQERNSNEMVHDGV